MVVVVSKRGGSMGACEWWKRAKVGRAWRQGRGGSNKTEYKEWTSTTVNEGERGKGSRENSREEAGGARVDVASAEGVSSVVGRARRAKEVSDDLYKGVWKNISGDSGK